MKPDNGVYTSGKLSQLLPSELDALNYLQLAWEFFLRLPQLNNDDRPDFLHHVHAAQRIILSRPALRDINWDMEDKL